MTYRQTHRRTQPFIVKDFYYKQLKCFYRLALKVHSSFNAALFNMESTIVWALCCFWKKENLDTFVPGLCLLLLVSVPQLEATIPLTIGTLALTAPQVTGLIALKALALGKGMTQKNCKLKLDVKTKFHEGFLIGRLLSRRGRRSADERFNIDGEIEADLVSQLASDEVRQIILLMLLLCKLLQFNFSQ